MGLYDTGRDACGPGKLEIKGRHVILNCFLYRYVEVELLVIYVAFALLAVIIIIIIHYSIFIAYC